jgi:formylglycine-generating enzyme required for sulfatase activity
MGMHKIKFGRRGWLKIVRPREFPVFGSSFQTSGGIPRAARRSYDRHPGLERVSAVESDYPPEIPKGREPMAGWIRRRLRHLGKISLPVGVAVFLVLAGQAHAGAVKTLMEIKGEDGAAMVLVPAGWFIMGADDGDVDQKPRRRVYLDAYYIDKFPVTNARFGEADIAYGPRLSGKKSPAVGVSWYLARDYCRSFRRRLPTEAEWEKAARGTDGRVYPWGNRWNGSKLIWRVNSRRGTHPVDRSYSTHRTPFGAADMVGHVWEWVADRYAEDAYRNAPDRNPKGPEKGSARVLRGGGWMLRNRKFFRTFHRTAVFPTNQANDGGFRCAMDAR